MIVLVTPIIKSQNSEIQFPMEVIQETPISAHKASRMMLLFTKDPFIEENYDPELAKTLTTICSSIDSASFDIKVPENVIQNEKIENKDAQENGEKDIPEENPQENQETKHHHKKHHRKVEE